MGCTSSSTVSETEIRRVVNTPPPPMQYRLLGSTGLKVSTISYSTSFNTSVKSKYNIVENVKRASDLGINYFDVTDHEGTGDITSQFANAFKSLSIPREDLVISTKIYWGAQFGSTKVTPRKQNLNRKYIKDYIKNSLKNLKLEYFDIVFCHYYDSETPLKEIQEIARAFTELISEGLLHYWGTSEWSPANIHEMREICSENKLIKPSLENPHYNLFARERQEQEYARLFDRHQLGSIVQSPLAYGILSGQFNKVGVPSDVKWDTFSGFFHLKKVWDNYFTPQNKDKLLKILDSLDALAKELEMTQSQLAISWVISNKDVSSATVTSTKMLELEEAVACLDLQKKITPEVIKKIDKIIGNTPDQGINFKSFTPFPPRR